MTSAGDINLLILSDDPVARAGLEAIVDKDTEVSLLGRFDRMRCPPTDAAQPHVIILGEPPSKRFICENVQQILATYGRALTRPRTLVVSRNDDDDVIVAALRVGVNGYLSRINSPEELLHSIRIVAGGGAAFSSTIAARFSRYFSTMPGIPKFAALAELTGRELEILELLAEGLGNRQIARLNGRGARRGSAPPARRTHDGEPGRLRAGPRAGSRSRPRAYSPGARGGSCTTKQEINKAPATAS